MAVPVLALAFTACGGDDDTAYCVDQNDQIVENQYCDDEATAAAAAAAFFWYYGGSAAGGEPLRHRHRASRAASGSPPPTSPRTPAAAASAQLRLDERQRRRPRRGVPQRGRLMERIDVEPRQGWPAIIEQQGLIYWKTELPDGSMMPYWHESQRLHAWAATRSTRWRPASAC